MPIMNFFRSTLSNCVDCMVISESKIMYIMFIQCIENSTCQFVPLTAERTNKLKESSHFTMSNQSKYFLTLIFFDILATKQALVLKTCDQLKASCNFLRKFQTPGSNHSRFERTQLISNGFRGLLVIVNLTLLCNKNEWIL